MNLAGLSLFALGVVLLFLGSLQMESFSSEVSQFFGGNPTDRSIWLLVGGAVAAVAGFVLALKGARRG